MESLTRFLSSSIGRKLLMGITGLLLIGFLIMHLAGNLLVFVGAEAFNHYSEVLISNPFIYVAEAGLLLLFVVHFVNGITLTLKNRTARPVAYVKKEPAGYTSRKSLASTTMILSGLVVLVFVPLHIWTFKLGPDYPVPGHPEVRDLYRLVMEIFASPAAVVWYVVALTLVGFHLWHGFGSGFESLGVAYRKPLRRFGQALAVVLAGGFIVIPIIVYLTGGKP